MKKTILLAAVISLTAIMSASAADAKANFENQCAKCHGKDGKGDTAAGKMLHAPDFTDPKVQASFTDEKAFKAIKEGVKDSEGRVRMKPIEGLSDDEVKALVQYVRSFKK